jgi:hypothetical protein
MKNKLLLFILTAALIIPQSARAQEKASASSASIQTPIAVKQRVDNRAKILERYLQSKDSPLAPFANEFVTDADKYNLDWRLVAAISGVESTFGQAIPPYSYNGWGWGVYGDNVIRFKSWPDGINTVSQGLRERYIDKWGGKDIYQIGAMYASSPAWANHVNFYLNNIDSFIASNPEQSLSLSL